MKSTNKQMKTKSKGFGSIDLSKLVIAERKYHTKPRPIGNGLFAFEIITVNSRQWIGPGPDGTTESIDLPPILWWCLPQGLPTGGGQ